MWNSPEPGAGINLCIHRASQAASNGELLHISTITIYIGTVFLPQSTHRVAKAVFWRTFHHDGKMSPEAEFFFLNQHWFICRPSDSTVSEDAGIEPRTVATTSLTVRRSHHSARSNPHSWTYNFAEISRQNLESYQTWGFCMDFLNHREGGKVFYQVYLLSPLQCAATEL